MQPNNSQYDPSYSFAPPPNAYFPYGMQMPFTPAFMPNYAYQNPYAFQGQPFQVLTLQKLFYKANSIYQGPFNPFSYLSQQQNLLQNSPFHGQDIATDQNIHIKNEDKYSYYLNRLLKQDESQSQEQRDAKNSQKHETVRQIKKVHAQQIQNKRGHWTNEEHYKYLKFVRQHKDLFENSTQKKLNRVFKMMSMEIPSRTACQCRSHFSKFNPLDQTAKIRRKLVNNEDVYEKMFQGKEM
ncbi:hypothetical protein pb186bvf_014160 [Paramecium bursaria]